MSKSAHLVEHSFRLNFGLGTTLGVDAIFVRFLSV